MASILQLNKHQLVCVEVRVVLVVSGSVKQLIAWAAPHLTRNQSLWVLGGVPLSSWTHLQRRRNKVRLTSAAAEQLNGPTPDSGFKLASPLLYLYQVIFLVIMTTLTLSVFNCRSLITHSSYHQGIRAEIKPSPFFLPKLPPQLLLFTSSIPPCDRKENDPTVFITTTVMYPSDSFTQIFTDLLGRDKT